MRDNHLLRAVALGVLGTLSACGFTISASGADAASDGARGDAATDARAADAAIDGTPDASVCDQLACTAAGGTCALGACLIDQDGQGAVVCPSGMPCKVLCDTGDACKTGGVDCAGATSCEVACQGTATCQTGGVDCGQASTCLIRCEGSSSCQQGVGLDKSIECRDSMCTVTCTGSSSCQDGIDVDTGTCASHCCNGACQGGFDTCTNDNVCI